eukprot:2648880-Pyramimonas_sp.AAC.1
MYLCIDFARDGFPWCAQVRVSGGRIHRVPRRGHPGVDGGAGCPPGEPIRDAALPGGSAVCSAGRAAVAEPLPGALDAPIGPL